MEESMLNYLLLRLQWTLCLLVFLLCTVPASAQVANPKANLDQAVQALQKAEQQVANEPEAASSFRQRSPPNF